MITKELEEAIKRFCEALPNGGALSEQGVAVNHFDEARFAHVVHAALSESTVDYDAVKEAFKKGLLANEHFELDAETADQLAEAYKRNLDNNVAIVRRLETEGLISVNR